MARARVFPFDDCDPRLLLGTGHLYLVEDGIEVDVGNVALLDFSSEGSTFRVFTDDSDSIGVVVVTTGYRFSMQGDSYSIENLGRLLNESVTNIAGSSRLNLQTIRKATIREAIFEKDLRAEFCASACPDSLQIRFWRGHFDGPFRYSFNPAAISSHAFEIIALPDDRNHSTNPFGYVDEICSVPSS